MLDIRRDIHVTLSVGIVNSAVHKFSKNPGDTSKSWYQKGGTKQVPY